MKIKTQKKGFHISPLLLAYLIPFLGMLILLAVCGYEPFGNNKALLYSDEYHQYYPFFVEFRNALRRGDSLLYSWNVGMGMDYLGLISYYLASPLNLLSVLVPEALTLEYFAILPSIKLGLASLFFAILLKKLHGKDDYSISLFGAAYGLCAWALGYQWNIMWLDTFALLPLVVLGTVLLLRDKKTVLYTVSLTLSVLSNYYIGFFTCIFVLLLFICYEICRFSGIRRFAMDLGRIALFSILAIGMTAFLELPALAALQNTQSSVNTYPDYFDLNIANAELVKTARAAWDTFDAAGESGADFFQRVSLWFKAIGASFPPIMDGMRQVAGNMNGGLTYTFKEGLPNIYCGCGTIVLAFLFLTAREIKWRDKLCAVALLVFFMLSFLIRQLDYIWHGFHFTNMIPYRFSFLFSFVMLYMAYRAWLIHEKFQPWQLIVAGLLSVAILLCCTELSDPLVLGLNLGLFLLYLLVLLLPTLLRVKPERKQPQMEPIEQEDNTILIEQDTPDLKTRLTPLGASVLSMMFRKSDIVYTDQDVLLDCYAKKCRFWTSIALIVLMGAELLMNLISFGVRFPATTVSDYPKGTKYANTIVDYMHEREDDNDFFRAETTHSQTLNDGALNGYNGISTFTSSANVRVTEFMAMLGYGAKNTYNRYCFEESSPVANLFLNLKYMLERDANVEPNAYFNTVHGYGPVFLQENNAYLPLGFLADSELANSSLDQIDAYGNGNNFFKQNYLFKAATGLDKPVWNMVHSSCLSITGSKSLTLDKANNATGYTIYHTTANAATLRYTYTMNKAGFLCLDLNMSKRNSYKIYKNNEELFSESMTLPQMIAVCDVQPGDKIYIDITCKSNTPRGVVLIRAAQLDDAVFRRGYDILNASTLDLTKFSTTRVEGTINCNRDGLLYTSIPYDGNWVATVDGEEVEQVLVGDAMIALKLTKGNHKITFRYKNRSFTYGLIISLVCFAGFMATIYIPRYREKNKGKYLKKTPDQ